MLKYHQTRKALGSYIHLNLVTNVNETVTADIFRRLWLEVFLFEKRCSRFLPDSELSQLNRQAGVTQHISPEFRRALQAAKDMAASSEGLYNPFILPALQRAGYVHSLASGHVNDPVDDYSARAVTTPEHLEIGADWARIPYGTALDLGGCGKGLAGDILADIADEAPEISGYWFSMGGDIVARGVDATGKPWVVGIESAATSTAQIAANVTTSGTRRYGVATSSTAVRGGTKNGAPWHHIIDPLTNQPATSDVLSASVVTDRGISADVLASCAILKGSHEAETYLRRCGATAGLLQTHDQQLLIWGDDIRLPAPDKSKDSEH